MLEIVEYFFSVELSEKSPVKDIKKSTRGVHFTILPASPCAAEFHEIWRTRSTHRHNHACQIFSQSVQGLRSSDTPKMAISHRLLHRPYNSVALPCDIVMYAVCNNEDDHRVIQSDLEK